MDISLAFPTKPVMVVSRPPDQQPPAETRVVAVKAMSGSTTLPADKAFVAPIVTAKLSGAPFPENPGEIAPSERTLRPYDTPMLPYEKQEDVLAPMPNTAASLIEPDGAGIPAANG